MKNLLQIRDQQQNRRITLILWLLLGSMSMGIMLWTAAHKTVVISALSQEQGGLVTENQAERSHEMQLDMAEDRTGDLYTIGNRYESGKCSGGKSLHGKGTLDLCAERQKIFLPGTSAYRRFQPGGKRHL